MAIWLIRAGSHGEYEQKFITENRVYVTWDKLAVNLKKLPDREALFGEMSTLYQDAKPKRLQNWVSQVWPFAHEIEKGDLVFLPLKTQPAICVGEVTGEYQFEANGPSPYFHSRKVKWIAEAIPRDHFGQDILNSLGAFLTICRIKRNNAEERLAKMRANGWKPETVHAAVAPTASDEVDGDGEMEGNADLEAAGRDQIGRLISARFKKHDLTRLVDAILQAQGYTTYRSPEGADGGADILAGSGPLGFGTPRLCVEVKSEESPIGRPDVDKLLGAVSKFGAQEGLFVSWSGFKSNVFKEMAPSFFKVRLWTQKELLEALFANYDRLDEDLKAELPLKRIWTVAAQDEE
jgi:restriction system protein